MPNLLDSMVCTLMFPSDAARGLTLYDLRRTLKERRQAARREWMSRTINRLFE